MGRKAPPFNYQPLKRAFQKAPARIARLAKALEGVVNRDHASRSADDLAYYLFTQATNVELDPETVFNRIQKKKLPPKYADRLAECFQKLRQDEDASKLR